MQVSQNGTGRGERDKRTENVVENSMNVPNTRTYVTSNKTLTPFSPYAEGISEQLLFRLSSPKITYSPQPKGAWADGPALVVQITAPGSVGVMEGSTCKMSVTAVFLVRAGYSHPPQAVLVLIWVPSVPCVVKK